MEENTEKKGTTEELKTEASSAVNQVKETIKKVDIKKDSIETKGFIAEIFKDPLGKIQEIATKDTSKFLTYAIIILIIWSAAKLINSCFTAADIRGYYHIGTSILSIIKSTITPAIIVIVMSVIILILNNKNKKSLTTIITLVITAKLPVVIASIISLLTLISSEISVITSTFSSFCSVISIILLYFSAKAIFGTEKNSEFIKTFVAIEGIYYIVYFVLTFLGIYI